MATIRKNPRRAVNVDAKGLKGAPRAKPSRKVQDIPVLSTPHAASAAGLGAAMRSLPPNYEPEGFEVVGDTVRVFGRVRPQISPPADGPLVDAEVSPAYMKRADVVSAGYPPPPALAPARTSPLAEALERQFGQLVDVSTAMDDLEHAISFVAFPELPSTDANAKSEPAPRPVTSAALEVLENHQQYLTRLVDRIRYLTSRVQA